MSTGPRLDEREEKGRTCLRFLTRAPAEEGRCCCWSLEGDGPWRRPRPPSERSLFRLLLLGNSGGATGSLSDGADLLRQ